MLATCSQDGAVILWAVGQEITKYKQLVLEEKSVTFVAWKNDDTLLLAVSEHLVAVWNVVVRVNLSLCGIRHQGLTFVEWGGGEDRRIEV